MPWVQRFPPEPALLPELCNPAHRAHGRSHQHVRMRQNRSVHHRGSKKTQNLVRPCLHVVHSVPAERNNRVQVLLCGRIRRHHYEGLDRRAPLEFCTRLFHLDRVASDRRCTGVDGFLCDANVAVDTLVDNVATPEMDGDVGTRYCGL